jgi:transcriptional regulator with XRE-family HTH domain
MKNINATGAAFLRERRRAVKKTIRDIAAEVGWDSPQSYGGYEKRGASPKSAETQTKLARALGVSLMELLRNCPPDPEVDEIDIMPIVKGIVEAGFQHITRSDLEFLISVQAGLNQPLSVGLIQGLMQRRSSSENAP